MSAMYNTLVDYYLCIYYESKQVLLSGQYGQINSRKLLSELAKTEHIAHWSAEHSFVTITGPESGTSL